MSTTCQNAAPPGAAATRPQSKEAPDADDVLHNIEDRVAVCIDPLVVCLFPSFRQSHCSYCLLRSAQRPKACAHCRYHRYCCKECQRKDWIEHKLECEHLKGNERLEKIATDDEDLYVLLLMTLRLILSYRHGKLQKRHGPNTGRGWADLVDHMDEVMNDDRDEIRHAVQLHYMTFPLAYEADKLTSDLMIEIYAKLKINCHMIHEYNYRGQMVQVGTGLCLDASAYDHSCRPNAMYAPHGRVMYIVPTAPGANANNVAVTRIRYVDLAFPRAIRRAVLRRDQYFVCECPRCTDKDEPCLTAMKCPSCGANLPIALSFERSEPSAGAICSDCQAQISAGDITIAQDIMERFAHAVQFPHYPGPGTIRQPGSGKMTVSTFGELRDLERLAEPMLSRQNVIYCRLLRKIGDSALASAELRAQSWLANLDTMKACWPRCWGQELLEESIRTVHALLNAKMFPTAESTFQAVLTSTRLVCFNRPCPFAPRLAYLQACISNRIPASDALVAEVGTDDYWDVMMGLI